MLIYLCGSKFHVEPKLTLIACKVWFHVEQIVELLMNFVGKYRVPRETFLKTRICFKNTM